MIHIEYILVISAVMLFAGIYGFLTRKSTLAMLLSIELMLKCRRSQLCVFKPIALQRNSRRFVLFDLRYRHCSRRKCRSHRDNDQHLSSAQQHLRRRVEEDEVVTLTTHSQQWNILF